LKIHKAFYRSEIGLLEIRGTEEGVLSVRFRKEDSIPDLKPHPSLSECLKQLDAYFNGSLRTFDLKLNIQGTDFQKSVWNELRRIPYGETTSYGEIAACIGRAKASRAVGNANNRNKVVIIIPCHRVIAGNGRLAGFGGGLWRKEWLLEHEKEVLCRL
jgi:methylated-DNA-[protein]-cysteine S-methyltransferase